MDGLFRETGVGNFFNRETRETHENVAPTSCPHFNKCSYENPTASPLFIRVHSFAHHSFASLGVEDGFVSIGGSNCLGNPNSKEFGYRNGRIPAICQTAF